MLLEIPKKVETKESVVIANGFYKFGSSYYKVTDTAALMVTTPNPFSSGYIKILTPEKDSDMLECLTTADVTTEDVFDGKYYLVHNAQANIQLDKLLKTA